MASTACGLHCLWPPLPVALCCLCQVVSYWLKAVDAANSWSFVLGSLGAVAQASARDEQLQGRVHARVAELLAADRGGGGGGGVSGVSGGTPAASRRAEAAQLCYAELWPDKLIADVGIRAFLPLSRRARPEVRLVARQVGLLSNSAPQVNDALRPEQEMAALLARHAGMHRTKSREEFELLADWVTHLEVRLQSHVSEAATPREKGCNPIAKAATPRARGCYPDARRRGYSAPHR